jgi:hypothetical protein
MTAETSIFDRIQDMLWMAKANGIHPVTKIELGAVKTLEWEKAFNELATTLKTDDAEPDDCSFNGIPVVLDSETPGISVG